MTIQRLNVGNRILSIPGDFGMEFLAPKAAIPYCDKVRATQTGNLIAYWPLWEATGTVADNYEGTAARDGTYYGVTLGQVGIGDGNTCPEFDGGDHVAIGTVSLINAFNGSEGTAMVWARVIDPAVWSDGQFRFCLVLSVSPIGDNQVALYKRTTPHGDLTSLYTAGGVGKARTITINHQNWFCIGITWSESADEVRCYYNGVQQGATLTDLGVWAGSLNSNWCCIGSNYIESSNKWKGLLAHAAVWSKALTPAEMAALAVI